MRFHDLVAAAPEFGGGTRCLRCGWRSAFDATGVACGDPIRQPSQGPEEWRPSPGGNLLVALNEVELLNLGSLDGDQLDQLDVAVKRTMEGTLRLLFKIGLERFRRKSDAPAGHSRPTVVDPPSEAAGTIDHGGTSQ
jgi:hypothetical protein